MKRRLLMVAGMSALLVASVAPAPGTARSPERFGKVDLNRKANLDAITGAQGRNRVVMVAVELEGRPVAAYEAAASASGSELSRTRKASLRATIGRRQAAAEARITRAGGKVEATFTDTFNGFRVRTRANKVDDLARIPGVKAILNVTKHTRDNANTIAFLGADRTWAQTGFTGKGVKIAVIDTGINFYHADFNGAGYAAWKADNGLTRDGNFPTAKVVGGWDLVGDAYNADDPIPDRNPDPNPLDCKSADAESVQHGTHVAGTAAGIGVTANGQPYKGAYTPAAIAAADLRIAPGVAPEAKLMAYRVFGCEGSTYVTADAIEMAVRDGADIINMSLGSDFGNPGSLDAVVSDNAALSGVTVVSSSGNSGPSAYETGSPAASQRTIAVAAIDAQPGFPGAKIDMPSGADIKAINANDGPLPVTGKLHHFVDDPATAGDPDTGKGYEQSGCMADSYAYNDFKAGEIAVVQRGFCARTEKAKTGEKKNAAAVIQVNNATSLPPFENDIAGVTIPFIGVSSAADARFKAADGKVATIKNAGVISNGAFREIADFSSAGPGRIRNLVKPEVTAPGVSVFSADGSTVQQGKSLSGTSMASPAVAGVAALVKQAHPSWNPRAIKGAIVATAAAGKVVGYDVRLAGAGVAQPRKAVDTKAVIQGPLGSSSLAFGYQQAGNRPGSSTAFRSSQNFTIVNTSNRAITYDLRNRFRTGGQGLSVVISPRTVTVPANGRKTVTVSVSMSNANAARLPSGAPKHTANLKLDGFGQLYTAIDTIAGTIVADPRGSGAGIYDLGVPWLVVPRPLSRIQDIPGDRVPWTMSGDTAKSSIKVRNYGIHFGRADVFSWGLVDGEESVDRVDLRAGGVQSLPSKVCDEDAAASDRCLVFALNLWGTFNNASEAVYDVAIDLDNDGSEDILVTALDLGIAFGTFFGVTGSVITTIDNEFINAYFAGVSTNGSTILLPVLASDLGLKPNGKTSFRYFADSFVLYDDFGPVGSPVFFYDMMTTGSQGDGAFAWYDAFKPVLNDGAFKGLQPGRTVTVPLTVDRTRYRPASRGQKGWMIVSLDDENGRYQAELIPVGTLPS
jgi:subtilisin family serine protease